ncbi:MAG: toxin-antitoxin system HicB family antitoxin [Anaerolineaceae bacterium]|jgi:predicted HicB family RNase H-like nuclease|nr:toxin-antitoxin system HicB family antitoxin [Anaerolineaceae bacterium]
MPEIDKYTYRVTWSEKDKEFVGLCTEFPSLSWLDSDRNKALSGISQLVVEVVADMEANGEEIPEPLSLIKFSGRFQVRISPHSHRNLAMQAAELGISMNRLASSKLEVDC